MQRKIWAGRAGVSHLFVDDGAEQEVATHAAVLKGHIGAQHARLAGLPPNVPWDDAALFPSSMMWHQLLSDEPMRRGPKYVMFFGEDRARDHGRSSHRASQPVPARFFRVLHGGAI